MLNAKYQKALEALGLDEKMYVEILNDLIQQSAEQLTAIDKALAGGDKATVSMLAHSIKGAAANMRVEDLASAAKDLEKAAKSDESNESLKKLTEVLRAVFNEFCQSLKGE